jgi:hypothetical protein
MKWFDKWLYKKTRDMWENSHKYDEDRMVKMGTMGVAQAIERGRAEGEGRITFELSTAVGGKILNVSHYDERKDRHDRQTYVIPNGEDIGERVAKIVNLEMFKR